MSGSLDGRVAIVTGASRGIGMAIAAALGDAGASVALSARGEDDLEAAVTGLRGSGANALGVPGDAGDADDVRRLVDAAVDRWDRVDVAVANAGGVDRKSVV